LPFSDGPFHPTSCFPVFNVFVARFWLLLNTPPPTGGGVWIAFPDVFPSDYDRFFFGSFPPFALPIFFPAPDEGESDFGVNSGSMRSPHLAPFRAPENPDGWDQRPQVVVSVRTGFPPLSPPFFAIRAFDPFFFIAVLCLTSF